MIYDNKEVYGVIYKITNIINNKVYIGQTVNWNERLRHHKQEAYRNGSENSKRPIYRSIRKYGLDNFVFDVIGVANSKDELDELEKYYIKEYNSIIDSGKGYNLEKGGSNGLKSEFTKKKIRDAQKGELNHMFGKSGELNPASKKVKNMNTGIIYTSITECALSEYGDAKYVKPISTICNPNSNKFSLKGNVYCFLDEDGNEIIKNTEKIKNKKYIKVIDKVSGIVFDSIEEVSKYFNISSYMVRDRIYNRIKNDKYIDKFNLCLYDESADGES